MERVRVVVEKLANLEGSFKCLYGLSADLHFIVIDLLNQFREFDLLEAIGKLSCAE